MVKIHYYRPMKIGENPIVNAVAEKADDLSPQESKQVTETADVVRKTLASVIQAALATQRFNTDQMKQVEKIRNAIVFDTDKRGGEALAFTKKLVGMDEKDIQKEVFNYLNTNHPELFGIQEEQLYSRAERGLTPGYKEKKAETPVSEETYQQVVTDLVQRVNNPQLRADITEALLAPREYKMRRTLDPGESLAVSIKRKIHAMLEKYLEDKEKMAKDKTAESFKQKRPAREVLEEARQQQMSQTRDKIQESPDAMRAASENRAKIQEEMKSQDKPQFTKQKPSIWKRLFGG